MSVPALIIRLQHLEKRAPATWAASQEYAEIARALWPDLDPLDARTIRLAIAVIERAKRGGGAAA